MANGFCPSAQKANVQRVFAVLEEQPGILQKPTAESFVLPAGRASISQSPSFTDSPELSETLDVVSQSRDAMPAGDWSVPMVLRLTANAGAPQGDTLLHAALGKITTATGTRTYNLDVCRPSFSLWVQHDEIVQFMSGCMVESVEWSVEREGLVIFNFSGRGRKSGIVGVGEIKTTPSGTTVALEAGQAMAFSVGGFVANKTKNQTQGYEITAINTTTDTLTLAEAPTGWVAGEEIGAWVPTSTPIGTEVENNSVLLYMDGVEGRMRPSTFSASLPTQFLEEIGDEYPGEAADNRRSVSLDMSVYFRKNEAVRFGQTLEGKTMAVKLTAENAVGRMELEMPKVRITSPTVGEDDAVLTLDSTGTALGINGEDSFSLKITKKA